MIDRTASHRRPQGRVFVKGILARIAWLVLFAVVFVATLEAWFSAPSLMQRVDQCLGMEIAEGASPVAETLPECQGALVAYTEAGRRWEESQAHHAQQNVVLLWMGYASFAIALLVARNLWIWFSPAVWRLRKIQDTPTSRIRSAVQGRVELEGVAAMLPEDDPGPQREQPPSYGTDRTPWLIRKICAAVSAVKRFLYVDPSPPEVWWERGEDNLVYERSEKPFLIRDETGDCRVDPRGVTVEFVTRLSEGRRGFRHSIRVGDPLHLVGFFSTARSPGIGDEIHTISQSPDGEPLIVRGRSEADIREDIHKMRSKGLQAIAATLCAFGLYAAGAAPFVNWFVAICQLVYQLKWP